MALQSSGPISLNDIATEFGGSTPHSLSEYYGAGGAPSSGAISLADFYGRSSYSDNSPSAGSSWTADAHLYAADIATLSDPDIRAWFKVKISSDGTTIATWSRFPFPDTPRGRMEVWRRIDGTWTNIGLWKAGTGGLGSIVDSGGAHMSNDGNVIAFWDSEVSGTHVYTYSGSGTTWILRDTITNPSGTTNYTNLGRSGINLSENGDAIMLQSQVTSTGGYGSVHVFDWNGSSYGWRGNAPFHETPGSGYLGGGVTASFNLSADGKKIGYVENGSTSPIKVVKRKTWNGSSWGSTVSYTDSTGELTYMSGMSDDGSRVLMGLLTLEGAEVWDVSGSTFVKRGATLTTGCTSLTGSWIGRPNAISGDGNVVCIGGLDDYSHNGQTENGIVETYLWNGSAWVSASSCDLLGPTWCSHTSFAKEVESVSLSERGGVLVAAAANAEHPTYTIQNSGVGTVFTVNV